MKAGVYKLVRRTGITINLLVVWLSGSGHRSLHGTNFEQAAYGVHERKGVDLSVLERVESGANVETEAREQCSIDST